jgi:carbonic anhydrase
MSETERLLRANEEYAKSGFPGKLPIPPARRVAVLACMDARLNPNDLLGLKTGEAHIIRNAGGIATDDAIRSFIISNELLGTKEFVVINHTDCGMLTFKDNELAERLAKKYGHAEEAARLKYHSFNNLEENVKSQVNKIKNHPLIPKSILVSGFIYEVESGKLRTVVYEPNGHTSVARTA